MRCANKEAADKRSDLFEEKQKQQSNTSAIGDVSSLPIKLVKKMRGNWAPEPVGTGESSRAIGIFNASLN